MNAFDYYKEDIFVKLLSTINDKTKETKISSHYNINFIVSEIINNPRNELRKIHDLTNMLPNYYIHANDSTIVKPSSNRDQQIGDKFIESNFKFDYNPVFCMTALDSEI